MLQAMRHSRILLLALGMAFFAAPGSAQDSAAPAEKLTAQDQREVALDRLFASLHKTSDEQAAKAVEEKIWELWSRFDSPTAEVLLGQAVVAMNAAENTASLEILDRIIASYPAYAEAWNKRATLQFVLGNYDASLKDIEKVLDLEPRHFGALAGRGMIYQSQENWTAALNAYREALSMNPTMTEIKDAIKELSKRERDI